MKPLIDREWGIRKKRYNIRGMRQIESKLAQMKAESPQFYSYYSTVEPGLQKDAFIAMLHEKASYHVEARTIAYEYDDRSAKYATMTVRESGIGISKIDVDFVSKLYSECVYANLGAA